MFIHMHRVGDIEKYASIVLFRTDILKKIMTIHVICRYNACRSASTCFNIVTHLRSLTVDVPGAVAWCRCWPLVLRAAGGTNPAGRCLI